MHRKELVRRFVLNEISDDYECLHQIMKQLTPWSSGCGLKIEPPEVIDTLSDLIADGLVKAYRFSGVLNDVEAIDGMPPIDEIGSPHEPGRDDAYFWVTGKGMQLQLAKYPDWPYDDNNVLRSDWKPPEG